MTGTAVDGMIDLAALRTDGETVSEFGPWALVPYPDGMRGLLAETLSAARDWNFDGPEPAVFARAEAALTRAQAEAASSFVARHRLTLAVIGFHGQTVLHRPPAPGRAGRTRQLGDGSLMAQLTRTDVVYDFRSADVAAGGQGAPLAAAYHAALLRHAGVGEESAVLNLGGVANLTWQGADGTLCAFDTGPANGPLNDWVERHLGEPMDRDGALARAGRPDEARVARALNHPFFSQPFPKSLDRFDFAASMAEGLGPADGAATLTAFAAAAVGRGLDLLPRRPSRLLACGGGRHNPTLMNAIEARAGVRIAPIEQAGLRGDAIEAECFAFLAVRRLRGLPISFPRTTGVDQPLVGGQLSRTRADLGSAPC